MWCSNLSCAPGGELDRLSKRHRFGSREERNLQAGLAAGGDRRWPLRPPEITSLPPLLLLLLLTNPSISPPILHRNSTSPPISSATVPTLSELSRTSSRRLKRYTRSFVPCRFPSKPSQFYYFPYRIYTWNCRYLLGYVSNSNDITKIG